MNRVGKPAELNGLAVFLASEASGFMTGSSVLCDVSTGTLRMLTCIQVLIHLRKGGLCSLLERRFRSSTKRQLFLVALCDICSAIHRH